MGWGGSVGPDSSVGSVGSVRSVATASVAHKVKADINFVDMMLVDMEDTFNLPGKSSWKLADASASVLV